MSGLNIFAKLTPLKTRLINIAGKVPAYLLNALTPSTTYNKTKGQSFGSGARDSLDIYRAKTPKADAPVLIFIHGGAWDRGSKGIYKFWQKASQNLVMILFCQITDYIQARYSRIF